MKLTRKRQMAMLQADILNPKTRPGVRVKAIQQLNQLEAGKKKRTKPSGRPFQKKVEPVVEPVVEPSAPLIDQVLAEEKRRREAQPVVVPEPSDFEQRVEQIRLKAESAKKITPQGTETNDLPSGDGVLPPKMTANGFFQMATEREDEGEKPDVRLTYALLQHWETPTPPPPTPEELWPDNDWAKPPEKWGRR